MTIRVSHAGAYLEVSQEKIAVSHAGAYLEVSQEKIAVSHAGAYIEVVTIRMGQKKVKPPKPKGATIAGEGPDIVMGFVSNHYLRI